MSAIDKRLRGYVVPIKNGVSSLYSILEGERLGQLGVVVLATFTLTAIFAPELAPYEPYTTQYGPDGGVLRLSSPTPNHPLGTTLYGYDVLSQLILGARLSMLVGVSASFISVFVGTNIGLLSGYYSGVVDSVFMRITDIAFALPFLPFALIFIIVAGQNLMTIVIAISLLMWRSTARVVRSQVLTHKERPYVESAEAVGSSDFRIIYIHILPNILPLAFLYAAFSVAWAIIIEASISFLGFGDTTMVSWGRMIFQADSADAIREAWWWVLPPGLAIILLVMSVFFISRALEKMVHPSLRHR
jgi:peptide/nickel transport system permease protein